MKSIEYPAKIILAWGEAISGNTKIRDWLIQNGYPELGIFVFALHHKDDARQWLIKNGHEALMALINATEGNKSALKWLNSHGLEVMSKMAQGADNSDLAINWLVNNKMSDLAVIAHKIREVKNIIDDDNNDVHKISSN